MSAHILVVEDEADLAELVAFNLRDANHTVVTVADGASAHGEAKRKRPDLVVLDIMLPDISGIEVCRRFRRDQETRDVPILMLTARGEEVDRVVGFEVGADDYVLKPFSPRELVLRVEAILRRSMTEEEHVERDLIVCGDLTIDVPAHRATVCGTDAGLTALEFRLLLDLASRKGRVQPREALLERVWGYAPGVETRTVDTHVKRLREKLGEAAIYVETVRGVGYRLRDSVQTMA
ncbi:MAG: response regulator transcription factor [Myxococcota bacterium]